MKLKLRRKKKPSQPVLFEVNTQDKNKTVAISKRALEKATKKGEKEAIIAAIQRRKERVIEARKKRKEDESAITIGDAVKVRICSGKHNCDENVYVKVTQIGKTSIRGIVKDIVWWPQFHGIKQNDTVSFTRHEVLKVEKNATFMAGLTYLSSEQRGKTPKDEAEEVRLLRKKS